MKLLIFIFFLSYLFSCNPFNLDQPTRKSALGKLKNNCIKDCPEEKKEDIESKNKKFKISIQTDQSILDHVQLKIVLKNREEILELIKNNYIEVDVKDKDTYRLSLTYDSTLGVCQINNTPLEGIISKDLNLNINCIATQEDKTNIQFSRVGNYSGNINIQLDIPDESESFELVANQPQIFVKSKGKSYSIQAHYDQLAAICSWTPNSLQGVLSQNLSFILKCDIVTPDLVTISLSRSGNFIGNLPVQVNVPNEEELVTIAAGQSAQVQKSKGKTYSIEPQYNDATVECVATPSNLSGTLTQNININFECNNKDIGNNSPLYENPKLRLVLGADPATSMRVIYNASSSNSTIHYGLTDNLRNFNAYEFSQDKNSVNTYAGMKNTSFRLENLQANSNYYFVIKDGVNVTERFWFTTLPNDSSTPISIISGGDSRNNHTPRKAANQMVAKLRPHFVMFGGDFTSSGTDQQWKEWFDHWQLTITDDKKVIPLIPTRGNHEDSNSEVQQLFDTISPDVYYAQSIGGNLLRIYTMNTEISTSGDQKDWFSQDLAQNADQHIYNFVQFHRQMSPPTTAKSMKSHLGHWAPLIHQNKVTAVFESDSHLVCVFHPIRPSNESGSEDGFIRDDDTGTVYAGAGTWGAPLREANDQKNWTRDAGSFNQFKWVFVNKSKVEIRTVQYENLSNIAPRTDSNRFEIPANLNLWEPSNGGVVTIYPENAIKAYWLSPANNSHFNSGENINLKINIDMTNANGTTVNNVKFYLNQNLLGAAQSIGNNNYQYSWDTIGFEGVAKIYAEFTLSDGSKIKTNENNYNIGIITKIFEVTNENDDGEEYNGSMNLSSSDLEMVYDGSKKQKIGIRFDSLDIPKNSNIKEVYLIFNAKYSDNQTVNLEVEIEQSSSASNFSNKNLTERNYFEETVSWTPDQWTKDNNYQSSNLKELLQLVVNQNDWAASNAIVFKIEGDDNARRAYSCNYDECSKGPKLKVIYAP